MTKEEQVHIYTELLLNWNKIHNLGGNLDKALIDEYIADSAFPLDFIEDFKTCMDIGSGAGFPAIVLAIYKPESKFMLVEPRQKRCAFLQYVCMELGLDNVEIHKKRIEDMDKAIQVDLITSRALMPTQDLIILTQDFLKSSGHYLFYKGGNLSKEITQDIDKYVRKNQRIYFYERKSL